jgi:methionyl-tRNA synthetase
LTANAPETKDNDFTWKDFQARNNNELVAIFGNFINRVVVLTNKYFDGQVPKPKEFSVEDQKALEGLNNYPEIISNSIERYRFREALSELMNLARLGNKYLADEEPWKQIKTDPARVETIMYVALQIASGLAVLCEPFLPFTSIKLKTILGLKEERGTSVAVISAHEEMKSRKEVLSWNDLAKLPSGHQIGKPKLLFAKIEDAEVQDQIDKLEATKIANKVVEVEPQKETISFEDFTKLDIRIGTILEAEKIPKTKKLLKLKIDVGIDTRTIVSGIAESFMPDEIIGQRVSVLVNLAPRKLRGVESQGMILMSDTPDGKLTFIEPEKDVQNGGQIS